MSEPMNCHCGKVALYQVGKLGFCRDHYDQAKKAAIRKNLRDEAAITLEKIRREYRIK